MTITLVILDVASRGRGRGRGRQGMNKALVECYYCHDLGHFQNECPKKHKEPRYEEDSKAHFAETEELLLMAYVNDDRSDEEIVWFLDSGCSNHVWEESILLVP